MSPASILLVHSPLVGPSSLARLAAAAADADLRVSLPDLTRMAESDNPHDDFCRLAVEAGRTMNAAPLVVGHSGAGAFLPAIGSAIGNIAGLVFVDAVVPPAAGVHTTSRGRREMLDSVTEDGVLRRWLDWWPEETILDLLPNEADRIQLEADMPRVPRSFYDHDVDVPPGWSQGGCGYLMLSDAIGVRRCMHSEYSRRVRQRESHLGSQTGQVVEVARRCDHASRPGERCLDFNKAFKKIGVGADVVQTWKWAVTVDHISFGVATDHLDVRQALQGPKHADRVGSERHDVSQHPPSLHTESTSIVDHSVQGRRVAVDV